MAPQNEEQRARLLKAARNKRYYEKKKSLQMTAPTPLTPVETPGATTFAISSPPPSSGSPPPTRMHLIDRLPILGRPFLPDEIPWLHTLLETWGYYNDLPKFVEDFHRDYHHTRMNPSALAAWVRAKDDWMTQGDIILELIEDYLVVDILEHRQGDNLRRMWKGLTEVVFRIQWIMTAADVRLHAAEVGHPLSDTGVAEIIEDEALEIED